MADVPAPPSTGPPNTVPTPSSQLAEAIRTPFDGLGALIKLAHDEPSGALLRDPQFCAVVHDLLSKLLDLLGGRERAVNIIAGGMTDAPLDWSIDQRIARVNQLVDAVPSPPS